ncbi:MAG: 50S ribosomal protein L10 [Planctomycetaceae bacterium]|nr:50S ribosomal protein L10 [Planctomycetaceae bacterium]
MSKRIKQLMIADLKGRVGETSDFLVIDSSKMDAITDNQFRLALRAKDISVLTVRNSLAKKAFGELGVDALDPILEGPSTVVWGGEDIVALSKEIAKWAKEIGELEIKGGAVEGSTLDASAVDALSKSPSREELIGKIAMLALSPGGNIAGALLGPVGTVCGQIKSKAEEEE